MWLQATILNSSALNDLVLFLITAAEIRMVAALVREVNSKGAVSEFCHRLDGFPTWIVKKKLTFSISQQKL